ncbi:MAG: GspH/FimT family pseudopilin [Gammaproteobacteria bacterium]
MNRIACSTHAGVGLIELLVGLAVATIALAIAVPAYSELLLDHRLTAASNGFLNTLHFARSEAIKRNGRVVVCKSSGEGCTDDGGWEQGWLVFHDRNNNAQLDADDTLLRLAAAMSPTLVMSGNSKVDAYVSYTPLGLTKKVSGAFQAGTFTLCAQSETGGSARQIVIGITGRPRVQKAPPSVCS